MVVSTGFGNGTAIPDARPRATGAVQASGFASADVPAPPTVHSRPAETAARVLPAEILSKPTPLYTQEARSLRIEGEVLLEVVLEASGKLRVLRVVHGLGHGLDDNAVKAAEQIHFKPAVKDGQPTDSRVVYAHYFSNGLGFSRKGFMRISQVGSLLLLSVVGLLFARPIARFSLTGTADCGHRRGGGIAWRRRVTYSTCSFLQ